MVPSLRILTQSLCQTNSSRVAHRALKLRVSTTRVYEYTPTVYVGGNAMWPGYIADLAGYNERLHRIAILHWK